MENYNASKRYSYIMYLDVNNLHGWAMLKPLTTSNFKWLTDEEMKDLHVKMIPDDSSRGYILDFYLYFYLFLFIDSFIAGKAFIFMFICFYLLIHLLQVQLLFL